MRTDVPSPRKTLPTDAADIVVVFGSLTNRKNGIINTANQIAVNGPTARVPSRIPASRPRTGSIPIRVFPVWAFSANKTSITISANSPPT